MGLLLAALLLVSCADAVREGTEAVRLGGRDFRLELAADPASRAQGLMGRGALAADGGMLFVFPDRRPRRFWMANVPIDLDVAFLDDAGRIVAVHTMRAEPPRAPDESQRAYEARIPHYASEAPARFAIELRAGTLAALGLAPGDRVALDRERLLALAR